MGLGKYPQQAKTEDTAKTVSSAFGYLWTRIQCLPKTVELLTTKYSKNFYCRLFLILLKFLYKYDIIIKVGFGHFYNGQSENKK